MAPTGALSNTHNDNSTNGNGSNNNSSKVNPSSNSSKASSRSKPPSGKQSGGMVSSESWDDLDDLLDAANVNGGDDQSDNGRKEFNYKSGSNNSQRGTNGTGHRQTNMSGSNNVTSETNHYVSETYREANRDYLQHSGSAGTSDKAAVSGMKLNNQAPTNTSTRSNIISSGHGSADSLSDSGKSNNGRVGAPSGKVTAPSPVGDDFFATFGI
jgi:hypothetical protein